MSTSGYLPLYYLSRCADGASGVCGDRAERISDSDAARTGTGAGTESESESELESELAAISSLPAPN